MAGYVAVARQVAPNDGGTGALEIGFKIKKERGYDPQGPHIFEIGAWQEVSCVNYDTDATMTAADVLEGSIIGGSGGSAVKVQASQRGVFRVLARRSAAGVTYFAVDDTPGGPSLDMRQVVVGNFV